MEAVKFDSPSGLDSDLYDAYGKQEPWLGYMWGTGDPALKLDLVRLEEPPYSDECWSTTKACAYEDATILIAVNPDLVTEAPDVIEFLRNWDLNINVYKEIARYMADNLYAEFQDVAIWFLKNNDVWTQWVTPEAAERVKAALADEG